MWPLRRRHFAPFPRLADSFPRLAVPFSDLTIGRLEVTPTRPESPQHTGTHRVQRTIELALLGNRTLQTLIHANFVCFPAQAPVFGQKSRRDLQWRLAVLYFVRGWSTRLIADRYGLTRERCGQIISDWKIRAIALGYIQDVTPEGTDLARLAESQGAASGPGLQSPAGLYKPTTALLPKTRLAMPAGPAEPQAATAVSPTESSPVAPRNPTIPQSSFVTSAGPRLPSSLR